MSNPSHVDGWIAGRMADMDVAGIRKVFELARLLKDPVNLSIGQPDFDVPQPVRAAACEAIEARKKSYAFPWQLASLVRAGMLMPIFMYDRIAAKNSFRE